MEFGPFIAHSREFQSNMWLVGIVPYCKYKQVDTNLNMEHFPCVEWSSQEMMCVRLCKTHTNTRTRARIRVFSRVYSRDL